MQSVTRSLLGRQCAHTSECLALWHSATPRFLRPVDYSIQKSRAVATAPQCPAYIWSIHSGIGTTGVVTPRELVVLSGSFTSHSNLVRGQHHLRARLCEPRETHSFQCSRARNKFSQACLEREANPGSWFDRRALYERCLLLLLLHSASVLGRWEWTGVCCPRIDKFIRVHKKGGAPSRVRYRIHCGLAKCSSTVYGDSSVTTVNHHRIGQHSSKFSSAMAS